MPDVILPVLNEVAALPWVLSRMPEGYRPIVVDNGSIDGSAQCAGGVGRIGGRRAGARLRRGVLGGAGRQHR